MNSLLRFFLLSIFVANAVALSLKKVAEEATRFRPDSEPTAKKETPNAPKEAKTYETDSKSPRKLKDTCQYCGELIQKAGNFCTGITRKPPVSLFVSGKQKAKYLVDVDIGPENSCAKSPNSSKSHRSCESHLLRIEFRKKLKEKTARCFCPNLANRQNLSFSDFRVNFVYGKSHSGNSRQRNADAKKLMKKSVSLLCGADLPSFSDTSNIPAGQRRRGYSRS